MLNLSQIIVFIRIYLPPNLLYCFILTPRQHPSLCHLNSSLWRGLREFRRYCLLFTVIGEKTFSNREPG